MKTMEENIDMRIQYYNKLCELKGYKYGYLAVAYVYGGCSLYYCSKADIEKKLCRWFVGKWDKETGSRNNLRT